jgi:hypothetical protein
MDNSEDHWTMLAGLTMTVACGALPGSASLNALFDSP